MRDYFTLLKFYQHHSLGRSLDLQKTIEVLEPFHEYPTRFSEGLGLNTPRVGRSKFYHSFVYRGTKLWNQLPDSIHSCSSFDIFKHNLRKHLNERFNSI